MEARVPESVGVARRSDARVLMAPVAPDAPWALRATMAAGDLVIYLADPLMYGKLIVLEVAADGRLLCEQVHADRRGDYGRELFDAHELELASAWKAQAA